MAASAWIKKSLVLFTFAILSFTSISDCAKVVHVGDNFMLTCAAQKKEGKSYFFNPAFEFMRPDSDRWETLFTGPSPRPETNVDEWDLVTKDGEPKEFTYTLKTAKPSNGGKYRCNNIDVFEEELTVVDPDSMECPRLQDEHDKGTVIKADCSLQKSGPQDLAIEWFLDGKDVTDDASEGEDAAYDRAASMVEIELTEEHNGQELVCQYDGVEGKTPSRCSVILNVLYPVQITSTTYERVTSASSGSPDSAANEVAATSSPKSVCKLRLTGNPAPNADEINVQAPEGVVDKLETQLDDGSLLVAITYLASEEDSSFNFTYAGDFLGRIELPKFQSEDKTVGGGDGGSSGAAVAIGIIILLLILVVIGAAAILIMKKKQLGPFAEKAENEEETAKLDAEKGDVSKEEAEKKASSEEISEPEKEKLTKIEDVQLESEKGEEQKETKDEGKHDDQPPNAEEQKE